MFVQVSQLNVELMQLDAPADLVLAQGKDSVKQADAQAGRPFSIHGCHLRRQPARRQKEALKWGCCRLAGDMTQLTAAWAQAHDRERMDPFCV